MSAGVGELISELIDHLGEKVANGLDIVGRDSMMAMSSLEMTTTAFVFAIIGAGTIGADEAPLANELGVEHGFFEAWVPATGFSVGLFRMAVGPSQHQISFPLQRR